MYALEIDQNGIIRGKCFIQGTAEQIEQLGVPGPYVSNGIGDGLILPAEPVYDGENIIGGKHRPDLLAPVTLEVTPTADERIAALEAELGALKKEQALLKVMKNAI